MTFQNLNQNNSVHQIGRDMEFWSDGEFARFGFDVEEGICMEVGLEDIEEFADAVEKCETGHFSFNGRLGSNSYLFEKDHPSVHVYHNQTHVASFVDYEKYPLPEISKRVREERIDWDVETEAEKIVGEHISSIEEVDIEKQSQHIAKVTVKSDFFKIGQMLRLCSIEEIERGYHPDSIEAESVDEFVTHVERLLGNTHVQVNDDGRVEYRFKLDTRDYQ